MKVKTIKTQGALDQNCYVLEIDNNYLVVDPGSDYEIIKQALGGNLLAVLVTHKHFDHIGALESILNDYEVPLYDFSNVEEKKYEVGPFNFEILFTPGHSKDSITFYFPKERILFTGDFLFKETIGRTDLDGGSNLEIEMSLVKIKEYPDDLKVYPGHGEETSLGYEKCQNPYLK